MPTGFFFMIVTVCNHICHLLSNVGLRHKFLANFFWVVSPNNFIFNVTRFIVYRNDID